MSLNKLIRLPSLKEIDIIRKSGFRPQVVGCFLNDKKILFLFTEKYNLWQLPQGGIDNKETIKQAIIREMTEELGEEFVATSKINSLIGDNQVEFPNHAQNSRELKTDAGDNIFMQGKKYFFVAIDINIADIDINKTEFDDYKWLDYENAMELSKTIYQHGKQRVTADVLEKLHSADLL